MIKEPEHVGIEKSSNFFLRTSSRAGLLYHDAATDLPNMTVYFQFPRSPP